MSRNIIIGFDRPLRPHWIYESLLLARPAQRLAELYAPFEQIVRELTGREGKRKVRTVLFRCFLRDEQNKARVRPNLVLKDLSLQYGLDFMTPIYLFYLVARTEVLRRISDHIFRLYDYGSEIKLGFLKAKMVESFGERDVVLRSARAFIQTLEHFGVVARLDGRLILYRKLPVSEEQAIIMLQLFAADILHSPQISLHHLPAAVFNFFDLPDLRTVAQKYNGELWDYQYRMVDAYLVLHSGDFPER
ncbi:hypothetical protein MTHERMOG20_16770 [Moorella thermoacetica]|uniref:DUF1819 family protein n=1 Tax=Moorella thermoacetica (strain ATCC 39073 / JCM 9320) TaxID=264732 RepID=Q2RKR9_MOOTA|nr:hypothetical protein [Moorella thermoacetica]AKX96038.1 hypothetical protein MOTHA_c06810 [Moorella thermoacetica]OIQ56124.1 hypothetical protein MOCA_18270 [Moorella thermoacetica]QCZ99848.1 hypothetical protein MothHH_00695 [Moorella thermoacetica]TYL08306.1 hypothetical protein MOLA_20340 [Moorella thermoacetica]TYL08616.1 hypothetical protein MOOCA_18440 [Moorella thermoacetica]